MKGVVGNLVIPILGIIITVATLVIGMCHSCDKENRSCEICREIQMMEIAAKVDSVFKEPRCPGIIALSDGQFLRHSYTDPSIYHNVEPGDSIFKPKGLFKYFVYKQSNKDNCVIFSADYDCDFECRDCINYENVKKMEIKSRVKETYNNSQNKFLIIFEGSDYRFYNNYTGRSMRKIVASGDSIYKPSGIFKYYIYKQSNKDSCIVLEGDCGCDD